MVRQPPFLLASPACFLYPDVGAPGEAAVDAACLKGRGVIEALDLMEKRQ
jgi:hypothetical protein